MNQNAHIVTRFDRADNSISGKQVFTFSSREKAVKKMKELYQAELDKNESEEFYCDFCNPPFMPYAFCGSVEIDYFRTEIQ